MQSCAALIVRNGKILAIGIKNFSGEHVSPRKKLLREKYKTILDQEGGQMHGTYCGPKGDLFLSAPFANTLISITLRTCTHTNVTSQVIIYPNPNPNQKKISNLEPETLTLFVRPPTAVPLGSTRHYKKG